MKYERVKCWSISASVFDLDEIKQESHDMDLLKSILKNGYRAYCINDREEVERSEWYRAYQIGERPVFYIDGSGVYNLANIDLTENELYFEKNKLPVGYEPWIFTVGRAITTPPEATSNKRSTLWSMTSTRTVAPKPHWS